MKDGKWTKGWPGHVLDDFTIEVATNKDEITSFVLVFNARMILTVVVIDDLLLFLGLA